MNKITPIPLLVLFVLIIASCKKKHSGIEEEILLEIKGFSPAQNIAGSDLMIKGSGFAAIAGNNIVSIDNTVLTVKQVSDTSLIVNIPIGAKSGKITVSNGISSLTSNEDYLIFDKPYTDVRLKFYQDGYNNQIEFVYDNSNRIIARKESWINPISQLFILRGVSEYSYNTDGLLEKEIYTPVPDQNLKTITEYFYTNGTLTSDKVSSLNNTDPANPTLTVTLTHTYSFIGNQLLKTTKKDGNGDLISEDIYGYDIKNGLPQFTIQTNSPSEGSSMKTYIQYPGMVEPYAFLIPGAPQTSLFLVQSAMTVSGSSSSDFTQLYSISEARLNNVTTTFPNQAGKKVKSTYFYEPRT